MSPTAWFASLALLVAVNLFLANRLARNGAPRASTRPGIVGIQLVIVAAWAYAVVPGLVQVFTAGRRDILTVDQTADIAGATAVTIFFLSAVLMLTLILVSGHALNLEAPGAASPATALIVLAPWVAMTAIALIENQALTPTMIIYPLIVFSFWRIAPPVSVASLVGGLILVTAAGSLVLGALTSLATVTNGAFLSKSLVSTTSVLAGPFTHPNQLGSFLALGLPSVLLLRSRSLRAAGITCVAAAVLWSASRTSIATIVVVLAIYFLRQRSQHLGGGRKALATGAMSFALVVLVLLPVFTHSSAAFNGRGQVWIASLARWQDSLLVGSGPLAYRSPGAYGAYLGPYAYHGHNMFVNVLALGGIVGILCVIPLVVLLFRRAVSRFADGEFFSLLFVLTFVIDGILEVSTDFWTPSPTGVIVWISIALVAFSSKPDHRPRTESSSELVRALPGRRQSAGLRPVVGIQPRRNA